MNNELKARLTSGDVWMRALYMIFFAIAYSVTELLITLTVIFQFLNILITGNANVPLLRFGRNLSQYVFDIIQFQTFNTEERPFPFSDWPDEEPGGQQWQGPKSGPATDAADSESLDETVVDSAAANKSAAADSAAADKSAAADSAAADSAAADSAAADKNKNIEAEGDTDVVSESRKDVTPPPA